MDIMVLSWMLSAASIAFLLGCVEYNRRAGVKKISGEESAFENTLLWISDTPEPVRERRNLGDVAAADASTRQLIRLYSALRETEAPVCVPADVAGEYAI